MTPSHGQDLVDVVTLTCVILTYVLDKNSSIVGFRLVVSIVAGKTRVYHQESNVVFISTIV